VSKIVTVGAVKEVCLLSVAMLLGVGACWGKPAVSLSPKSGPPTSKLLVSGSGFKPYAEIDISFDTKDEAKAVANGSGSFSKIAIHAPKSALPGKHLVSAVQRVGKIGAQAPFLVNTNWSQFGFASNGDRSNSYENELSPATVGGLKLLWSYTTGGSVQSSPSVVNGVVYVGSNDNNLYALRADTGAKLWSFPLNTGGIFHASPAVANGVVYIGSSNDEPNDKLYALDGKTGAVLWTYFGDGASIYCSPAVANGVVYFASGDGDLYALNAKTGALLWSFGIGFQVNKSPAVANEVLYTGSLVNALFWAINASTGAPLWTFQSGPSRDYAFNSSPAAANGAVYGASDDGNLYALNASTGTLLWSYPSGPYSEPAVANDVVYADGNGGVYALNATTGALLWNSSLGVAPAVADGVVYIVGSGGVYALNDTTGALLWNYVTASTVETRPAVANGVVYVGSDDGKVYAFGLTSGTPRKGVSAK